MPIILKNVAKKLTLFELDLGRRTACHARYKDLLAANLAQQICYYNFVRPHSALKFGEEM